MVESKFINFNQYIPLDVSQLLAEMRSSGCAPERLYWRNRLLVQEKFLELRNLPWSFAIISPAQTPRIMRWTADTDPQLRKQ